MDIRFLLRVPRDVLVQRRIDRQGYFTAGKPVNPRSLLYLIVSISLFLVPLIVPFIACLPPRVASLSYFITRTH